MGSRKLSKGSLIFILLWPLLYAPVLAQESGMRPDRIGPSNRTNSNAADTDPKSSFRLIGVLVSQSGVVALINGKQSREGDRVGGAEILEITEGAVRILMGSRELTVHVGSTVVPDRSTRTPTGSSPKQPRRQPARAKKPSANPLPVEASTLAGHDTHPVKQGETLSGISRHYLGDGVTMNQMMIALFQANPQAFGGNINLLHEGAILRIPNGDELHRQAPEIATAEVVRQTAAWRTNHQQRSRLAKATDQRKYGPVSSGETLSGIALCVLRDDVTTNEMMIALFKANPQAFSGNINLLLEGAILRIPDRAELRLQAPGTATAEVVRQTHVWRTRDRRDAGSATAYAAMTASSRESIRPVAQASRWK